MTVLPPLQLAGGRQLKPTVAFSSYWHLAAERQRMFFRRVRNEPPPWTTDPVLAQHRFTNAYRASDRVSQYLINHVIYGSDADADADAKSTVLRILLFKIFNRIDTWEYLEQAVGPIAAETFDATRLAKVLDERIVAGERLYSAAYIMPSPKLGATRKHENHLKLLAGLLDDRIHDLLQVCSLRELYEGLASIHSFGPFLAFQFAIDLNYSEVFHFSEMDFVVAGPGARDGIAKCFESADGVDAEEVIRAVTENADLYFAELDIPFESLWGRPLQLIDCQNLFCEVSKYARVAHPELQGPSGRTQIKQRYAPRPAALAVNYPPKWGLRAAVAASPLAERPESVADRPHLRAVATQELLWPEAAAFPSEPAGERPTIGIVKGMRGPSRSAPG